MPSVFSGVALAVTVFRVHEVSAIRQSVVRTGRRRLRRRRTLDTVDDRDRPAHGFQPIQIERGRVQDVADRVHRCPVETYMASLPPRISTFGSPPGSRAITSAWSQRVLPATRVTL